MPSPPANIAADIDAVIDDDDLVWRTPTPVTVAPRAHNSAGDLYLSPAEFTRVYELDSASAGFLDGTGVTIAVLGLSQIDPADVATFRTGFGLPPIDFAQGAGVRTGGNVEIEAVLDVTWAGALAPAAHIRLVQIVGSSVTDVFRGLVGSNADVISSSIDLCVKPRRRRAAALRVLNRVLRQAKAQGQTVLVASGDNGNSECGGGGFGLIESSPFVTAVGGTVPLPQESDTGVALGYGNEVAWSKSGGGSAGGGRPSWQRGLPGRGRVLPDVAFPAEVIYPLVFGGRRILVGGTSAGTPAWAGVIARLVQQRGRVGWINPRLYALGRAQKAGTGAAVFHDVVNGSNGTFAAGPGFDLVTGWGSIAGAAFLRNF